MKIPYKPRCGIDKQARRREKEKAKGATTWISVALPLVVKRRLTLDADVTRWEQVKEQECARRTIRFWRIL
jgi:hypothetical protein